MRLKGKVAVVTGGNSGIGLSIAREFNAQGARVAILGRDKQSLTEAQRSIGNGTLAVRGDVTNPADLDRLFDDTVRAFGKLDVLVANAGVAKPTPFDQINEAKFDETVGINFKGTFFTVQRSLPHLNNGASIVLVTSGSNQAGVPGLSVYGATKAAVRSMARTFAAELLPRGIRVNALCPGFIETPIFGRMGLPEEELAKVRGMTKRIPMKRFGRPEEVAKAALFLASDDSSYVLGVELLVDGGLTDLV